MRPWALLLLALTGCGDDGATDATLGVFAASSLTDAFSALEVAFEREHPDVDVAPSFAGSQILRIQIEQGAPADVYASADRAHMDALVAGGHVTGAEVFVHNALVVIVPPDNPAGIERFEDLPRAERLVLGDPNVPVGRYARELLSRTDFEEEVLAHVVSEEANVRLVRAKVELGEADAAIVYRTDASDRVRVIEIPDAVNVRADYHVGLVTRSERRALAREWIELLRGDAGRRALTEHGFAPAE